jgi:monofunctional biosynthetic peptidoglycan transglycosylase
MKHRKKKPRRQVKRKKRLRGTAVSLIQWALGLLCLGALVPFILIPIYAVINPISVPMLVRGLKGQPVTQQWGAINDLSDRLKASVLMAEDGKFCTHNGIDWQQLDIVIDELKAGKRARGASTITMQLVKNLFLWSSRSTVRKAIEMPLAVYADLVLSKRRILEIYLNVAQWGPTGQFGAHAGAEYFFRHGASALTWRKAALLAVTLPNPLTRDPAKPTQALRRIAEVVESRARQSGPYTDCL